MHTINCGLRFWHPNRKLRSGRFVVHVGLLQSSLAESESFVVPDG